MRKAIMFAVMALAASVPVVGCKPATTNPPLAPTIAPGYVSSADETIGRTLAFARGYYVEMQRGIEAGTYKPAQAELASINSFAITLNTAEAAYLAFHNGTGTIQAAQDQANQVKAQQDALQAAGLVVK